MTTDDLLKRGVAALKAGQKAEARNLLVQVVQQDEQNEMAWLWLSGAVGTDSERLECLEKILEINPNNGIALRGIETLRKSSPQLAAASTAGSRKKVAKPQRPEEIKTSSKFTPEAAPIENNEILQQAVTAIKSGDTERGKELLIEVIEKDESNENAWLWMTRCVADRNVKRECFERVLEINPVNEYAIRGLKHLDVLSRAETSTAQGSTSDVTRSSRHEASGIQKPVSEKRTRMMIGFATGIVVVAVILVGVWWVTAGRSKPLEPVATVAMIPTQISKVEAATSVPVSGPTVVPTWTVMPTEPEPTDTSIPTVSPDTPIVGDPQAFVFTLADMPVGFSIVPEYTGPVTNEDVAEERENPNAFLAQLEEWGRINGYVSGYEKSGFGTSYIESSIVMMRTSEGAHAYLEYLANTSLKDGWVPVSMPQLADESYAFTITETDEESMAAWTNYDLVFRKRNIIGGVYTSARAGTDDFDDAFGFAQMLVARISDTPLKEIPTMPPVVTKPSPTLTPTPVAITINETKELGPIWNSSRDESFIAKITVHQVRYDSGDEFSRPKQGFVYAIVDATVTNLGPSPMRFVGSFSFQVRDANGALRGSTVHPYYNECEMDTVDLGPDGSVSGCIGFQVPEEGRLELIYAPYMYEGLEPGRYLSFTIRR